MVGALTTPWVWEANDYRGNVIRATTNFDNATGALTGMTVFRTPACIYRRIYFGTGADGSPESTPSSIPVAAQSTDITAAQLANFGFTTINQLTAVQVTAGQ